MTRGWRSLLRRLLIGAVQGYRLLLSPWLGSSCRFTPSCSAYALEALQSHGARAGGYLAGRRVLRCHPGCAGGHDPVPAAPPGWLTRSTPRSSSSAEPVARAPRGPSEITP